MSKIDTFPLAGERVPENALSATNADTLDGNDSTFFLNASNLNAGSVPDAQVSAPSVQQHVTKAYVDGLNINADKVDGLDSTDFLRGTVAATISARWWHSADSPGSSYGWSGGYNDSPGSGSGGDWGATIWGLGSNYTGGAAGTDSSSSNVYGIRWLRSSHANANANAGEGLYVYQGGSLQAALGSAGIYVDGGGAFTGDPSFNTSDPRLKTEFLDFDSGSIIDAIEVGSYFWDKDKCLTAGFNHYDEHRHYGYNALDVYKTMGEYAAPIAPFDQDPKDKTKSKSGEEYRTGRDRELLSLALMEIKKLRKRVAELEAKNGL